MIFNVDNHKIEKINEYWDIKELKLEKILITLDEDEFLLNEEIFGEELFLIDHQVQTKEKKRADIFALDKNGNAVIIELKKEKGRMGVETQALQYLADFSRYKGSDFIDQYKLKDKEEIILDFLYDDITIKDLNNKSRIILIAQYFDSALFSMGEWLSENKVAFKCISFEPILIKDEKFLQFSVIFDQKTIDTKTRLIFSGKKRTPQNYWHNNSKKPNKDWWLYLIKNNVISASYDNQPGDRGEIILKKYIKDDIVFAYFSKIGCVGYGRIDKGYHGYQLIEKNSKDDKYPKAGYHLHRLSIKWISCIKNFDNAISSKELKEKFNIAHPIQTSSTIKKGDVEKLKIELKNRNEL